ncbi:M20/M25/M40 family metallo-hydrolase [bacterium]|nr:M20/M25/M40 family metallo-hydrolase [bacterium]
MLTAAQQERSLELVLRLLAIKGQSGHEADVAAFVVDHLRAVGVPEDAIHFDTAHLRCPIPESTTGNLIVQVDGDRNIPRRMLMAHMDTVPICVGSQPDVQGDIVASKDPQTGLGADDRAGVATVLFAVTELLQQRRSHGPLTLLFSVQEEIGLQGARYLDVDALGQPSLAFNWDGGDPAKLTLGAIGGYRMTIDIHGQASHAGVAPEKGVSAITVASLAIANLHRAGLLGKIEMEDLCGTSNIGAAHGGQATNVVADHLQLKAEIRSHQLKTIEILVERFQKAFEDAAGEVRSSEGKTASISWNGDLNYQAFSIGGETPSVQIASRILKQLDAEPILSIANGGLDANWLFQHGIPTVTLGCGQHNQHMTSERLDIPQFQLACEVAMKIAAGEGDA